MDDRRKANLGQRHSLQQCTRTHAAPMSTKYAHICTRRSVTSLAPRKHTAARITRHDIVADVSRSLSRSPFLCKFCFCFFLTSWFAGSFATLSSSTTAE